MKKCRKCGLPGPFSKNSQARDGLSSLCKNCDKKARKLNRERNVGRENAYRKKWIENNFDTYRNAIKMSGYRRRRKALDSGQTHTHQEWVALCKEYGNICVCCYQDAKLTRDHMVPLSKGGHDGIDNIQPMCQSCNSRKRDKTENYKFWFYVA